MIYYHAGLSSPNLIVQHFHLRRNPFSQEIHFFPCEFRFSVFIFDSISILPHARLQQGENFIFARKSTP